MWDRAIEFVAMVDRQPGTWTRKTFSDRWSVTPRSVSNVITFLRETVRVRVEADPGGSGYRLVDAGILDLKKVRARR